MFAEVKTALRAEAAGAAQNVHALRVAEQQGCAVQKHEKI